MFSTNLHIEFRVGFNKLNTNKNKNFLPEEIDIILNNNVKKVIAVILNAESNTRKEGYEDSEYRLDIIQDHIVNVSTDDEDSTITLITFLEGKYIEIPMDDYYCLVGSYSNSTNTCYTFNHKPNRLLKSGRDLNIALNDYCNRSDMDSPISELRGNKLYVYENNFTITTIAIQYVKILPIILNTDASTVLPFSNDFWRLVVSNAVNEAYAKSSGRYDLLNNEINKIE